MTTAEQEMPFPEDTREQISDLSSDLRRLAGAMSGATQLGQWDGQGVPGWVGEAADAYMASIRMLHGKLGPVVEGMRHAAAQADAWGEALGDAIDRVIPELHDQWRAVERKMAQAQAELDAAAGSHTPVPSAPGREGAMDPSFEAAKLDLKEEYASLIQSLNETAHTAAQQVRVAREMFLPPEVGSSRDEIGKELFKDGSILEAQTTWEHAQEKAEEITDRLEQGFDNDEELRLFLEEYGDDLEDPFVATALATTLPPEDLVNHTIHGMDPIGDPALRRSLAEAVGTTMVLASGGMNLSPEQRDNQELYLRYQSSLFETRVEAEHSTITIHQDYADRLTLMANGSVTVSVDEMAESPATDVIAQLMGSAGMSNPDLSIGPGLLQSANGSESFMEKVLRRDATVLRGVGQEPQTIASRVVDASLDKKLGDPVYAMTTLMDQAESVSLMGDEVREFNQARYQAAKAFLASDVRPADTNADGRLDEQDEVWNATRYIMAGRAIDGEWPEDTSEVSLDRLSDDLRGRVSPYSGFPDGGEAFGKLASELAFPESKEGLERMSEMEVKRWKEREEQGAIIASHFAHGYQDGLDWFGDKSYEGEKDYGRHNPAIRKYAADILGPRAAGLARTWDGNYLDGYVRSDSHHRHEIVLDRETSQKMRGLDGIFVDMAFDEGPTLTELRDQGVEGREALLKDATAIDKMILWTQEGYGSEVQDIMESRPSNEGGRQKTVAEATGKWAHVYSTLFTAPEGASGRLQQVISERNAWWQHAASSTATTVAGGIGLLVPGVGAYVAGQVNTHVIQPTIREVLPSGFDVSDTFVPKGHVVKEVMTGVIVNQAIRDGSLSNATETFEEFAERNKDFEKYSLDEEGKLLPLDEMTGRGRDALVEYIKECMPDLDLEAVEDKVDLNVLVSEWNAQHGASTAGRIILGEED